MSSVESNYKFAATHEWVKDNGDGTVTVGISEHAQGLLGDVVFVELPEEGDVTVATENFSLVESVKAASDVYAPVSGIIIAVNEALDDSPEIVNDSPFEVGWIAKIKLDKPQELETLMNFDSYVASLDS
ncbi:glycine cleavage system protein GcvH [Shewanella sp. D64]|uniref:glycine cleavage system protein GcvH n=1 Tax=unclassified Shewanella TaxID=196818 RepID=UPI0022BA37CC|nr:MULTISPECIES: glycine cleavage system protein GcvH [unclassified Shewanella]MEC4724587.1 glycine cleavage system protein GcvH [Shewanella sp. D64]MEC4736636.1 glycine cleavage system protein GcvH [Shewanella sp. E94]WBJ94692.1 glycine cleavage system protein GcvH [Shewanella sp. MTB7]